jgi:hypothetical protein
MNEGENNIQSVEHSNTKKTKIEIKVRKFKVKICIFLTLKLSTF